MVFLSAEGFATCLRDSPWVKFGAPAEGALSAVLKQDLAVGRQGRAALLVLGVLTASQGLLSCQFWWELGMWPGRRCGCLDILIEAWRQRLLSLLR